VTLSPFLAGLLRRLGPLSLDELLLSVLVVSVLLSLLELMLPLELLPLLLVLWPLLLLLLRALKGQINS
jgi:hypothetical protein